MADMMGGTPFLSTRVPELNGVRIKLLSNDQSGIYHGPRGAGKRAWHPRRVPAQGVDPHPEFDLPILSWHAGAGFSYAGLPNTYEVADGWDLSAPGRATTWQRHATGDSFATANFRGFMVFHAGFLYVLRGRYAYRYTPSTTPGSTWAATLSKDFGANMVVSGEPAVFKGILYVPLVSSATGAEQAFWQLTTPSTDTWTQYSGGGGVTARCFVKWRDLLVRGSLNTIYTVSGNPMLLADWSAGESVSPASSSEYITEFQEYLQFLLAWTNKGFYSIDENLRPSNELPDLMRAADSYNGVGSAYSNGNILAPHQSGLIFWRGGTYAIVGPNQERALEGSISTAWGRAADVVGFGKYTWVTANDTAHTTGFLYGFEAEGGRSPLTPHSYHQTASGYFEGMCIIQDAAETRSYLAVIRVDSATGQTVTPYIYQMPRDGYTPGTDPTVVTARDNCQFTSPRYFQPGREVQKTYRVYEVWLEFSAQSNHPGLQVWASVDNGAFFQLLDSSAIAKTARTDGFHSFYFPQTASAVGHHVRLKYLVPAVGGGESAATVIIRDSHLRGDLDPLETDVVDAMVWCGAGEFADNTQDRSAPQDQLNTILALSGPQAAPVNVKDPWGATYRAKVFVTDYEEYDFGKFGGPGWVANLQLRRRKYS